VRQTGCAKYLRTCDSALASRNVIAFCEWVSDSLFVERNQGQVRWHRRFTAVLIVMIRAAFLFGKMYEFR
jgi:hypothetical protein